MVDSGSIYLTIILPFIVLSRLVFLSVSGRMMTSVEEGNKHWVQDQRYSAQVSETLSTSIGFSQD